MTRWIHSIAAHGPNWEHLASSSTGRQRQLPPNLWAAAYKWRDLVNRLDATTAASDPNEVLPLN